MKQIIDLACIIDDDATYVNLVKRIIETKQLCNNLLVFSNGKEAFDYFNAILTNLSQEHIPEIILLDLNMPIMDGWEFLEKFLTIQNEFETPITLYVVSSSINPNDIEKAKEISLVSNYLVKPVRLDELEAIFSMKSA